MGLSIDPAKLTQFALAAAAKTGDAKTIDDGDVRAIINEADANGDGSLSRDEFQRSLSRKGFELAERTAATLFVFGVFGRKVTFADGCKLINDNAAAIERVGLKVGVSR